MGDVLVFSFLTYETTEIVVGSNAINVRMSNENVSIEGGFLILKKRNFFGRTFRKIGNWLR